MNAVLGAPEQGRKASLRDPRLLPRIAFVDPDLLIGCPRATALASGLDALTQVVEPYVSAFANRFTDGLCREAIPMVAAALPRMLETGDAASRTDMAQGSLYGGIALANAKLGAVHGLAGVIGGRTGAAHGAICGRLLGPILAANAAALAARAPDHPARARLAEVRGWIAAALGGAPDDAPATLAAWADAQGLPRLGALGLARDAFRWTAEASAASSSMKGNPIPLAADELTAALDAAA
jgi:Alcohol dehydrogenase, class IV